MEVWYTPFQTIHTVLSPSFFHTNIDTHTQNPLLWGISSLSPPSDPEKGMWKVYQQGWKLRQTKPR